MPPRIQKKNSSDTTSKLKKAGELRRSQLISTYGSGALVDLPRISGIVSGIDQWPKINSKGATKHERNLERLLEKKYFYEVMPATNSWQKEFSIPVFRFPGWYYCPECHQLDYYRNISKISNSNSDDNLKDLYCNNCEVKTGRKVKLIPSRFVVACKNGHIEDFPYVWWVHHKDKREICDNPQLTIEYSGTTGGLDSIIIRCRCGARASMAGCMQSGALEGLHCKGMMPWLGFDKDQNGNYHWYRDPKPCNERPRVMQRGANNVYYPVNASALTIPPFSSRIHSVMEEHNEVLEDIFDEFQDDRESTLRRLKRHFEKNSDEYSCSYEMFQKEAIRVYGNEDRDHALTEEEIRTDEYRALCDSDADDDQFKTVSSDIADDMKDYIDIIRRVTRLREVVALQGFNRISPFKDAEETNGEPYAPLSRQPLDWLPAIEEFGEGIFIRLREDKVAEWEKRNLDRYHDMVIRAKKHPWVGKGMFGEGNVRYILLHTLAHLLIRQITIQCGYSTSSINERIYSTYNGSKEPMSGILIFTASTDSDGSLGGLAREGEGERLRNTIRAALQEASWCSNDPICIDSRSQGYESLNYAACYACALLPETSCENANCLLDRASVVGKPDDLRSGFFGNILSIND